MNTPPQTQLPTGTITFLFSDMDGSSIRWEQKPGTMRRDPALLDRLTREAFEDSNEFIFKIVGDAFSVVFDADTSRRANHQIP